MRVSLRWLQEYVAVDVPVDKLKDLLDMSGTKVEAVHRPNRDIGGIVVAEVRRIDPHPNADNLTLVDVRHGPDATTQVVCGARNFAVGDRVALAQVGARLAGMEITERKIRGTTSRGMLCSGAELRVSHDHSGLIVLPADAEIGADVVEVLGLDDTILELEITPNRPDCLGMIGVAREVSALLGNPLSIPDARPEGGGGSAPVTVDVQDPEGCPRYLALYAAGVAAGPSPSRLATRLLAAGVRSISNVVDVTNYVMLETGQPLHAFDAAKVPGGAIIVRRARKGERLLSLDDTERVLHPDDLLIAGADRPLAIAGVMGGADSEVDATTRAIILESAYFDPETVAYTARRHGIRTEASARFERGVDPNGARYAADRAADLLAKVAAAQNSEQVVDVYPQTIEPRRIELRPERARLVIGRDISDGAQATHLRSIGVEVTEVNGTLGVDAPTFRPDLQDEVDLIEEVARLAGYETIGTTIPPGVAGELSAEQRGERLLKLVFAALGVQEAWTSSFASPADADMLGLDEDHPGRRMVALDNPMSDAETTMRTSLLPGLLRSAARSLAHLADGVALFEVARVYESGGGELPREAPTVGAVFAGVRRRAAWSAPEEKWDFFSAKGVLEAVCAYLGVATLRFEPARGAPFHPTRLATILLDRSPVGVLGELHPDVCAAFDVSAGTIALEITLAPLVEPREGRIQVKDLPKLPPTLIDVALVVEEGVPASNVQEIVEKAGAPEVARARLFDVYRGEQVEAGKKSLAFALELRAEDSTITDEHAVAVRDRIVNAARERVGGELRA